MMKKGAISGDGRAGRCLQRFLKQQTLLRHVLTIPAKIRVDSFNKVYYNHNRYKGAAGLFALRIAYKIREREKTKGSGRMADSVEYQIFIGCKDSQFQEEVVAEQELIRVITDYFERKRMDFSLMTRCTIWRMN